MQTQHVPVMLAEVLKFLQPEPGGRYIDGTAGGGGHTAALLAESAPHGRVLAIDTDPQALARVGTRLATEVRQGRLVLAQGNYSEMARLVAQAGFAPIQGIVLDLGFSSDQMENPERGFSFSADGPLDMRMNQAQGESAADLVNTKTSLYNNAPPGLFYPGDPGIPRSYTYTKLAEFGPRVGVVWDPTGSGRQVIRAGFGVFYDTIPTAYFEDQTQGAPWGSVVNLDSPGGGLSNPWLGYPGGNPFPLPFPPGKNAVFPSESSFYDYPLNSRPMYVDQWNLGYQFQLTNNWLIAADYVGNKTTHIWTGEDINPAVFIPGMCNGSPCSTGNNENQRRVLSLINPVAGMALSDIYHLDAGSNGEYEGLLLKLQHRFSNHYTILGNYTWSHCISETDFQGDMGGPYTQNPFNRNADRGNCGFDIRQIFNLTFIVQAPKFSNPWANRLLSDWQLSPIVSVHTGTWFYALDGVDNCLCGVFLDRPNVSGDPYVKSTTGALQWLNASAFSLAAPGAFGNSGRDSLLAPGYVDVDAAVSRYFNITERQRVELRFEFFNLMNHVNFSAPDNFATDATFGQILSDVSPRILQFALKYTF